MLALLPVVLLTKSPRARGNLKCLAPSPVPTIARNFGFFDPGVMVRQHLATHGRSRTARGHRAGEGGAEAACEPQTWRPKARDGNIATSGGGQTRDKVAAATGIGSGRTYDKAAQVWEAAKAGHRIAPAAQKRGF